MTRIPSGITDQGFYFVALDSLDYSTPKTGLTSFTVYRTRNGAGQVAMTTPTVNEIDDVDMPGWYFLLCDEDMTITSGNFEEEMGYRITAAGMVPVSKVIELCNPGEHIVEGPYSENEIMRLLASMAAGLVSGAGTSEITFRDISDTKDRIVADVDADGNRTGFGTLDVS